MNTHPSAEVLKTAALRYAERGFRVFPVNGKSPLAGSSGVNDATSDSSAIQSMPWCDATGLAIATGQGVLVVDCDPRNGSEKSITSLTANHGPFPLTATVHTGGGGTHFYYRLPPGVRLSSRSNALGPGLDVKAHGGYVVAPPSRHRDGGLYSWVVDDELAPAPDWVIDVLDRPRSVINPTRDSGDAPARIADGERNSTLTSLAGSMRHRGMREESIRAALQEENRQRCTPPLPEADVERIARSVARYTPGSPNAPKPSDEESTAEHFTDLGNALRLVRLRGRDLRFVGPWRKWLLWEGPRWVEDSGCKVLRYFDVVIKELIDTYARLRRNAASIKTEIASEGGVSILSDGHGGAAAKTEELRSLEGKSKAVIDWARISEARARIEAAVALARSRPEVEIRIDDLDRDPWALNVLNGTIDLRTGELRPHRREELITKLCSVRYDPTDRAPIWERFLLEVMAGEAHLVEYLHRVLGYSITADVREQALFFPHGGGANGKSTLLGAVRDTLGPDYAIEAMPELLMEKRGEAHPTERAHLFGKRFVSTIEVSDGRRLAEVLVKQLTGGDAITARRMREDPWSFSPTHKLFLAANHKPEIHGTDKAIWRRIRLIPFTVSFEGRADKELPAKLAAERPGILAWLVRGAREWLERGLQDPPEVMTATQSYREEMDPLRDFLAECCVTGCDQYRVKAREIFSAYSQFGRETVTEQMSEKAFSQRLAERGFKKDETRECRWWIGIALKTPGSAE